MYLYLVSAVCGIVSQDAVAFSPSVKDLDTFNVTVGFTVKMKQN